MGVGAGQKKVITNLLEMTEQRLNDILEFYQGKEKIEKSDKYYYEYSFIILLTLREIENIIEKMQPEKNPKNRIPQYNLDIKKLYSLMFTKYDFNPEKMADFQKKIKEIRDKLRNLIKVEDLKKDLKFSIIEDITNPNEEDQFYKEIIEKAYCYNFHKYFINNYIHDLIKLKMDGVNIYSKNVLLKLKMAKYISQFLLCIKLFIKYSVEDKPKLNEEEKKKCSSNACKEEIVLSNFLLFECEKGKATIPSYLIDNNEDAINELISLYQTLLKIINQIEDKISKNNYI